MENLSGAQLLKGLIVVGLIFGLAFYILMQYFNGDKYMHDMTKMIAIIILLLFFSFCIGNTYLLPFLGITQNK